MAGVRREVAAAGPSAAGLCQSKGPLGSLGPDRGAGGAAYPKGVLSFFSSGTASVLAQVSYQFSETRL